MFVAFLTLLCLLMLGHILMDFPLQTDFMAKGKNWNTAVPDIPWYYIMGAHCALHAGAVWLLTGSPLLGMIEFVIHFILDCLKCAGKTNMHIDQGGHFLCKVGYALVMVVR